MVAEENVGYVLRRVTEELWRLDQKHRRQIVDPTGCGLEYCSEIQTCLVPVWRGVTDFTSLSLYYTFSGHYQTTSTYKLEMVKLRSLNIT